LYKYFFIHNSLKKKKIKKKKKKKKKKGILNIISLFNIFEHLEILNKKFDYYSSDKILRIMIIVNLILYLNFDQNSSGL